ncbi:hypothetical protein E1K68_12450 [Pseudomonas sp. B2021]|nr:hypothetical protein [Pseudomonas sp. B2021]
MAAAHGFKPAFGHTEPRRGAEWWGKSVLLTLPLLQSEPPSGRNPRWPLPQEWICTQSNCVDCQAVFAGKPAPTVGSWCVRWIWGGWRAVTGASSLATGSARYAGAPTHRDACTCQSTQPSSFTRPNTGNSTTT